MTDREQALDLAAVESTMAAGRREDLDAPVVGPAAEGVRVDAEQAGGRAQGQPVRFGGCGGSGHAALPTSSAEIWVNLGPPIERRRGGE